MFSVLQKVMKYTYIHTKTHRDTYILIYIYTYIYTRTHVYGLYVHIKYIRMYIVMNMYLYTKLDPLQITSVCFIKHRGGEHLITSK